MSPGQCRSVCLIQGHPRKLGTSQVAMDIVSLVGSFLQASLKPANQTLFLERRMWLNVRRLRGGVWARAQICQILAEFACTFSRRLALPTFAAVACSLSVSFLPGISQGFSVTTPLIAATNLVLALLLAAYFGFGAQHLNGRRVCNMYVVG